MNINIGDCLWLGIALAVALYLIDLNLEITRIRQALQAIARLELEQHTQTQVNKAFDDATREGTSE